MPLGWRKLMGILAVALAALFLMGIPLASLAATTYTTTLQVVSPQNSALSGVTVTIYALNGTKLYSGTTNSTGYISTSLANGTYLAVVSTGKYYMFALFKVAGTTHAVINGTKLHYANITAVPTSASVTLEKIDGSNVTMTLTTNVTVYGDKNMTVVYPSSFVSFPYEYKLSQVKNATATLTTGTIFVNMTGANQVVVATYTQSVAYTSPIFLGIIALVIIIIIVGAYYAASHAIYNAAHTYVRRTSEEKRRFVRTIEGSETRKYVKEDRED